MKVILRTAIPCLVLFVQAWLSMPCRAQFLGPPVVNPARYSSSSGEYVLSVDPEDKYGEGAATYRLTRHGHQLWARRRPFTLHSAVVTDSGLVGGYGYRGEVREAETPLEIVIFDRTGRLRLHERIRRQQPPLMHASPEPIGEGVFNDQTQGRLVIRVYDMNGILDYGRPVWRQYRWTTGARLADFDPKRIRSDSSSQSSMAMVGTVVGTPLILVQWSDSDSAWFALLNSSHAVVWKTCFLNDYRNADYDDRLRLLINRAHNGAILPSPDAGRFALWSIARNARIAYSAVSLGHGRWKVSEVSQSQYPVPPPDLPHVNAVDLKRLGGFDLAVPGQTRLPEIRKVTDFTFAGPGRIAFLRDVTSDKPALVVTRTDGHIDAELPLPKLPEESDIHWSSLAWLGGSRYIVCRDGGMMQGPPAYLFEGNTTQPLVDLDISRIKRVSAFADGRFAVLGTNGAPYASPAILTVYSPHCKILWRHTFDGNAASDEQGEPISPDSVAVTTDGRVAIIDAGAEAIGFYDGKSGKAAGRINLKEKWNREHSYSSDVWQDAQGGLIILDFGAKAPIVRVDATGKVLAAFCPHHKSGQPIQTWIMGAQRSPDGKLWTSDDYALLRLDEKGQVDAVLGELPNDRALRSIGDLAIDSADRIAALEGRGNAIQVFDAHGVWLHSCHIGGRQNPGSLLSPHVSANPAGELLVARVLSTNGSLTSDLRMRFGADGRSKPPLAVHRSLRMTKRVQATKQLSWWDVLFDGFGMSDSMGLIASDGHILRTLARRADGRWFGDVSRVIEVGNLGLCVFDTESYPPQSDVSGYVSLYSATGVPIRTITLPFKIGPINGIAYNGHVLIVSAESTLYGVSPLGRFLWRFTPKSHGSANQPFFTDHGRTLTVWTEGTHFERYALP